MDPTSTVGAPLFRNPTLKNFAPRAGFAYSPGAKDGWVARLTGGPSAMSIRGGAGLYLRPAALLDLRQHDVQARAVLQAGAHHQRAVPERVSVARERPGVDRYVRD